jgi:hypothetical protein
MLTAGMLPMGIAMRMRVPQENNKEEEKEEEEHTSAHGWSVRDHMVPVVLCRGLAANRRWYVLLVLEQELGAGCSSSVKCDISPVKIIILCVRKKTHLMGHITKQVFFWRF